MSSAKAIVIIPARYASSRYPGKPLVKLKGVSAISKSLIERSWLAACAVKGVSAVYVATDDVRIADAARSFGAAVVMTSEACGNGTERCADALERLGVTADVIVNLQGDAPLTPAHFVESLIASMTPDVQVSTVALRCTPDIHGRFVQDRKAGLVGGTTVVADRHGDALYFSKEVIPFTGRTYAGGDVVPVFHHVGVYAYTPAALKSYLGFGACELERLEGLEQLRFLYNGMKMRCVEVEARGREFWELNNPSDVERIEQVLREAGIE
jgi:3-deoxy-manno-octulosonate cytidylyltransferase (CMP-KDO synthetase)